GAAFAAGAAFAFGVAFAAGATFAFEATFTAGTDFAFGAAFAAAASLDFEGFAVFILGFVIVSVFDFALPEFAFLFAAGSAAVAAV
ncbi:MAG: hypothetical protein WAV84_02240, partial [Bacteroidota bacterium]